MTRKARLAAWAEQLGVNLPETATAAQLEQAIENAIAKPAEAEAPQYSLRDGIAANLAVLRQELPGTVSAVASNLFGGAA